MEERSCILLIFILAISVATTLGRCPAGWTQDNDRCYYMTTPRQNYAQSLQYCAQNNASLVSISSEAEWIFVKSMLGSVNIQYYTSLTYNATSKAWIWEDGTPYNATATHWLSGRDPTLTPSYIQGHYFCTYMYGYGAYRGQMTIAPCTSSIATICERSADTYDLCNEADGWKDIYGKCYKLFNTKSTWHDARTSCLQNGGLLPSPRSLVEVMLLGDLIDCRTIDNNVWTAFTDQFTPGTIRSADTNNTMTYQPWASQGNIVQIGHECIESVALNNFYFNRRSCISENKYICIKPYGTCPTGWVTYGGKCYQVHNTRQSSTTWYMANDNCKKQGVQLLTIKDQQTNLLMTKALSALHIHDAWLGFSDRLQDGNYTWEDGLSLNISTTYTHWYKYFPKPIPGRTDCGFVANHGQATWSNGYCYASKSYLCEMPISQKYVNHTETANNVTCPYKWVLFRQDCYFLGSNLNWTMAQNFCQINGGSLTTIRDPIEQSFLIEKMLQQGNAWIGLKRDRQTTNHDFIWVDNTPLTFNNFAPGEPNSHDQVGQECVDAQYIRASFPGSWRDNWCKQQHNFICRSPAMGATASPAAANTVPWSYRCGPNWIISGMDSSCYQVIVGATKNWVDARADCLRRGSDLVSIDGPKEQTFLQAVLSSGEYAAVQEWFWIGANDKNREGGWEWSNQAPFRYVNWYPGEPNSMGEEDCSQMVPNWSYQWNDKKCSALNNYICEKSASPESTISAPVTQTTPVGKDLCRAEPMISGNYSLPAGQGALQVQSARDPNHGPEASRLIPGNTGGWSATMSAQGQWISATFYNIIITRGLQIAGRSDIGEWVTKFKLLYQYDYFSPWYTYQDPPGVDKVFTGCMDSTTTVEMFLNFPIEAKSIKLMPTAWNKGISLKWEILGCIEEDCFAEYGVSGPLFVQDGGFTASSVLDAIHSPHDCRLHANGVHYYPSCWKPTSADAGNWLEIDLGSVKVIRGVTTEGNPRALEWVTKYKVIYRIEDGTNRFFTYQEPYGTDYIFTGNTINNVSVTNFMKSHFQAQHVRISIIDFHTAIALRVDLFVCPITCREIPLISGPQKIDDSQITASSSLNSEHGPPRSRLNQPAQGDYIGAWEAEYNDKNQYIQVDLGRVVEVTAVATQGRDDKDQFVRAYTLSSSTDGKQWFPYYVGKTVQTFDGNWDSETVRKHYLMIPMNVRFLRLWPTDFQKRIALRWEVYGCPGPMSGVAIGCFTDVKEDRDLPYEPLSDPAAGVWPPSCIHHCYLKGYFYAGIQNGYECFCGNSYGKYGPAANCSMPCFPHPNMKCGGPLANYVHSTGLSFEKVCQDGWKSYKDDCYQVNDQIVTWQNARAQCLHQASDLASINSQDQQDFVFSLMAEAKDDMWLGLNDLQENMFYEWSNQRPVMYTNWNANEPSNQPGRYEDCVVLKFQTAGWQDENCGNSHKYICMAPKMPTTIPTIAPVVNGCEQGWDGYRWSCYLYVREARSWEDAAHACESFGASLVRIDDRYEQAYLASSLGSKKNQVWMDVRDTGKSGEYKYSDGVTHVSVTNWAQNKPDENGHCVVLGSGVNAGLWYNTFCNSTLASICERMRVGYTAPATLPPTPPTIPCPAGWVDGGTYCYQVNNHPINLQLSWQDSQMDCQRQKAHLASFHNASTLDYVWRNYLIGETDHFWVGLSVMDAGGAHEGYVWADRSPVDFTPWDSKEPDTQGGNAQCVEVILQTGKFNVQACWQLRNWICGIKKGLMPVPRTTLPVPTSGGACPHLPNWLLYNGYCYMAQDGQGDDGKTWRQARTMCAQFNAHLVSIGNINEQLFVQNLVSNVSDVHVWIGLSELDWDMGYRWSDGTPDVKFMNWNKNEPNDFGGAEACGDMTVSNGKWNDEHCSIVQGYVCKLNTNPSPPTTTPSPTMPGNCPPGFKTFGNRCFHVNTAQGNQLNWAQARKMCKGQGRGYDLASIRNAREQAFVSTLLLNTDTPLWLGMYKTPGLGGSQSLLWAFNNDPLLYTNWAAKEPNGDMKESCVQMYSTTAQAGLWNDISCEANMGFLCETWRKPYITIPEAIPNPCKQGWKPLGQDCFKLVTTPMTWSDGEAFCTQLGGRLTTINSLYEQAYMYLLATSNSSTSSMWIGMMQSQNQTGKYVWPDSVPVLYTNWGVNEPSRRPQGGCVSFNATTGAWSDDDCSNTLKFTCRITTSKPLFTPPPPNGQCPEDEWEAFGSSCYWFQGSKQLTFPAAVFQCEEHGGHLVAVHDNTTNKYLYSHIKYQTSTSAWIGLHKSTDYGFAWRDNSPVQFTNWAPNEPSKVDPSGKQEHCVEVFAQTGLWNDVSCDSSRGFVCEKPQIQDTSVQNFPSIPAQGSITGPPPVTLPPQLVPTVQTATAKVTTVPPTAAKVTTVHPTAVKVRTAHPTTSKVNVPPVQVTSAPTKFPTQAPTLGPGKTPPTIHTTAKSSQSSVTSKQGSTGPAVGSGGIAAIVLGIILLALVAAITIFIVIRRRGGQNFDYDSGIGFSNSMYDRSIALETSA
ncbi:lymphocyte antigen 75-like [Haliotis cracherodii]|uniref:lymphocyte antigen 75-like n=1 Tax=Haliotis cracherodii TaxID=6455 RepID=UPI0039E89139